MPALLLNLKLGRWICKFMRKLKLSTVIWSHLSDVQEMIRFYIDDHGEKMISNQEAINRINFVKLLTSKLDEGIKEMTEDELNEIWKKLLQR